MARRTFKNWFEAYERLCYEKGLNHFHVGTLDKVAFRETYFNTGATVEEAFAEELYYSN